MPGAFEMTMRTRAIAGYPPARTIGTRNAAVERSRELEGDERPTSHLPRPPGCHRRACLGSQGANDHLDPGIAQACDACAIGARIGILRRDDDARDPRGDQRVAARRSARAVVRARFECNIRGGTARRVARLRQRGRLGMRAPTRLGPAARHDDSVLDDQATDIGIGCRRRAAAPRQRDGGRHPVGIGGRALHPGQSAACDCGPRAARSASVERWTGAGFRCFAAAASASPKVSRVTLSASAESYSTPNLSARR